MMSEEERRIEVARILVDLASRVIESGTVEFDFSAYRDVQHFWLDYTPLTIPSRSTKYKLELTIKK
jgi:hypothetical protein